MKLMVIRIFCLFCFLLFSSLLVSALRINEIETNPLGTDAGKEWIEFYNNGKISLEDYTLVNNDGKIINLNRSFNGYFIYSFAKQWLDNSNETLYLYKGQNLIDKTNYLDDSNNNDLTWQFCNGNWKFLNSTKGKENDCPEKQAKNLSSNHLEEPQTNINQDEIKENEKIILTYKKSISDEIFITKEEKLRFYAIYSFIFLLILFIILLLLRKI